MQDTRFSLENVFKLRAKAFDKIRQHANTLAALAAATADLDTALTSCIDQKNIDEMQTLVDSARLLSDAMDGRTA